MSAKKPEIEEIPVAELCLDARNPRLPEGAAEWSPHEILVHLKATGTLDELAHSMVAEGFFPNEPLTVMRVRSGGFVALEGNRRVATLMMLLGLPAAGDERFFDIEITKAQAKRLSLIPALVVDEGERDKVDSFIGFRHIGGLKTWSPEAKARWIVDEVDKAAQTSADNPFLVVGRRVGQYGPSIRASYLALEILRAARDHGGVKIDDIVDPKAQRFGVWLRVLNSPEVKKHMNLRLTGGESYAEIRKAVKKVASEKVAEVIADLLPGAGRPAVLSDSRNVTTYGRVLADDRARKVLRTRHDLELAAQVIEDRSLAEKLRKETGRLDVLRQELSRVEMTQEVVEGVGELYAVARQMRSLARAGKDD